MKWSAVFLKMRFHNANNVYGVYRNSLTVFNRIDVNIKLLVNSLNGFACIIVFSIRDKQLVSGLLFRGHWLKSFKARTISDWLWGQIARRPIF